MITAGRRGQIRDKAFAVTALAMAFALTIFVALALTGLLIHTSAAKIFSELSNEAVKQALGLSLRTTLFSALLIVVFGTPLAALLTRPFAGRQAIETLVMLPVVLPPVVAGFALLMTFGRAGLAGQALRIFGIELPFTTAAVILAQTFVAAPLYVATAKSAFERIDRDLVDAAATLRASPVYAFVRVVLPPAVPALVSGLVLACARALGEFGATITFAGNMSGITQTMPVAVYVQAQNDTDAAIAIALVLVVISYCALFAIIYIMKGGPLA